MKRRWRFWVEFSRRIVVAVLFIAAFVFSSSSVFLDCFVPQAAFAEEPAEKDADASTKEVQAEPTPDLADIIPLATELSERLVELENRAEQRVELEAFEAAIADTESKLAKLALQVEQVSQSNDLSYEQFVQLKQQVIEQRKNLRSTETSLHEEIGLLTSWRDEWLADQERWQQWHLVYVQEQAVYELKATFSKVRRAIESALNFVLPRLKELLGVQERSGLVAEKIFTLSAKLDRIMLGARREVLSEDSPPLLSEEFRSQFDSALWRDLSDGLIQLRWGGGDDFSDIDWIVMLQLILALAVTVGVFRNREALRRTERWVFVAERPIAAGVFVGVISGMWVLQYEGAPPSWTLLLGIFGALSIGLLFSAIIEVPWRRHFIYAVLVAFILARILAVINVPLPIYRLFTAAASLLGIILLLRFSLEAQRSKEPQYFRWMLRLLSLDLAFVLLAEIFGREALPELFFMAALRSIVLCFAFILMVRFLQGVLEFLFYRTVLRRVRRLKDSAQELIHRVSGLFIFAFGFSLLLPSLLLFWGVYDTFPESLNGLMGLEFFVGSQRVTASVIVFAIGIFYGSFVVSWILQELLIDDSLGSRKIDLGVRLSIARLAHYGLVFVGFLLFLWVLGFPFTELMIFLSALGVGIGFGLQSIVNNFLSGLILLFERPVRVGDALEINGQWVDVRSIGLRATTVQTYDHADVIIPNADLVSAAVTNWTLSSRQVRVRIPVGVAYGSDVPLVIETLMSCAKDHKKVVGYPEPHVLFVQFGESSLEFELRIWVRNADDRLNVNSEIHQDIDRRFRENGIEIAFPQRDLHVRSVEKSILPQLE